MAIHLNKNPYHGINAHFNSFLQNTDGAWQTFHHDHITDLKNALNPLLPPGYYAVSEQSLQTQCLDDVEISEEDILSAVEIYRVVAPDDVRPVTRIEVLSPSNKTTERTHYLAMRHKTLTSGIHLVEVDYLHETPSPFLNVIGSYPQQNPESHPFYVAVTDPRQDKMRFYEFDVDETIPVLPIPLYGADSITLDFGAVYNQTFENDRRAHLLIDYSQPPMNFSAFSTDDQTRIQAAMERVRQVSES